MNKLFTFCGISGVMQTGKTSVLKNLSADKDIYPKTLMLDTDYICDSELVIGISKEEQILKTLANRAAVINQIKRDVHRANKILYAGVDVANIFPMLTDDESSHLFVMALSDEKKHFNLYREQMTWLNKRLKLSPNDEELMEAFNMIRQQQEILVDYAGKNNIPVFEDISKATTAVKERLL